MRRGLLVEAKGPISASPLNEGAASQLQDGGAPPPTPPNNADASGVDAIIKLSSAPEKQEGRKTTKDGRVLDEANALDATSNIDVPPATFMISPLRCSFFETAKLFRCYDLSPLASQKKAAAVRRHVLKRDLTSSCKHVDHSNG